ncbi:protein of unknown function [Candidatus Filomicrobium marinum]|uniref:Uncharacterized protein n=1 Tax=Candidatus Filomicrobium marinum TaxID=1608628 RepID=A0A0D6JJH7_9HYPH|nr:protein of unknown function [Candidatus Filomicrobium marinum]CPR21805.1 protein of unknown function [Candidatus Filomicrobium marinum]
MFRRRRLFVGRAATLTVDGRKDGIKADEELLVGCVKCRTGLPVRAHDRNPSVRRTLPNLSSFRLAGGACGTRKRGLDDLAAAYDWLAIFDARFNHDIHWTTGHDQVFGIVTSDEYQSPPTIKVRLRHDVETGLLAGAK